MKKREEKREKSSCIFKGRVHQFLYCIESMLAILLILLIDNHVCQWSN